MPGLKFFNTLTRRKEIFKPLRRDRVGLYTCGPTVYDYVHLGNLRTYIFQDVLKRTLEAAGWRVTDVMNTTDVDDKTIKGAKEAGQSLKKFTHRYEKIFKEDLKKLNILFPTVLTRATEYIPDMIRLIAKLLENGFAYKKDGSVYFSIAKFKTYGKLAHLDKKGLKPGARVDADEYSKEEVRDFVLWKGKRSGEPSWKAPFGKGRPGWHIECSAMSMKHLGETFDLHTAGVDLIFPHHENEIAQSEAATGQKFVKYWVHGEHLLVDGQKMSKSLRNFYTLRDLEEKKINPLAYRYLVLTAHYRSKLNFTWESLEAANQSLNRLYGFVQDLKRLRRPNLYGRDYRGSASIGGRHKNRFEKALYDDLQTPKAMAVVWDLANAYNKNPGKYNSAGLLKLFYDFDKILGLKLKEAKPEKIPAKISKLARRREKFRKEKQWPEADKIRQELKNLGWLVEDTASGPRLKRISK